MLVCILLLIIIGIIGLIFGEGSQLGDLITDIIRIILGIWMTFLIFCIGAVIIVGIIAGIIALFT